MKKPIGYFPFLLAAGAAYGQTAPDETQMQEVVVTGSRIIQTSANAQQPISIIDRDAIDRTGLASIGDLLQQLTAGGKALNAKFNSSGNFGYPADGGGIGAGSAQVDLRNLGSKRVLVLVDGIRWVNESSASGVSGARRPQHHPAEHHRAHRSARGRRLGHLRFRRHRRRGQHHHAQEFRRRRAQRAITANTRTAAPPPTPASRSAAAASASHGVFVASYYEQEGHQLGRVGAVVVSRARRRPRGRQLGHAAGPLRASAIRRGRRAATVRARRPTICYDLTLNNGTTTPVWNPADPAAGTYHDFGGADRFNFAPFNLLLTPSRAQVACSRSCTSTSPTT